MSPEEKIMAAALAPIKPMPIGWTDERTELAKRLYMDGLSGSQIAAEIGGITRNAVIGKINRMGWSKPEVRVIVQPSTASRRPRKGRSTVAFVGMSPRNMPQPEPHQSALSPDDIPRFQRKTIATLGDRQCRFPYGDPGTPDFFFCGAARVDPGKPIDKNNPPYCASHCRVAFIAGSGRKEWRDVGYRLKTNDPEAIGGFSGYRWGGKGLPTTP